MPNIHRFLLKTLCVCGVLFSNNAFGADWCDCTAKESCTIKNLDDGHDYSTCSNTFCQAEDQLWCDDFLRSKGYDPSEYTCEFTCPGDDFDASCSSCNNPWEPRAVSTTDRLKNCFGAYICPGLTEHEIPQVSYPFPIGYKIITKCFENTGITYADIIIYSCDTSKKYYATGDTITCQNVEQFKNSECHGKVTSLIVSDCTGCSTEPCNTDTLEWRNCSYSDMNCFGGNPGSYDPSLYERQVGYTFDASANNGNGSCTKQILHNGAWRCKQGYHPTNFTDLASIDITKEPYFKCVPCPVGYRGVTYSNITDNTTLITTPSSEVAYILDDMTKEGKVSTPEFNTCTKCPAGYSTFSSSNDAPLQYYEGAIYCDACPSGYFNDGTQNIDVTVHKIYGVAITPVTKTGNGCALCPQNKYSTQDHTNGTTYCADCPAAFITDKPIETDRTTHNVSVKKCYIDPNVMLSDSLGKIKLSEEIGSETKLYHK